MGAHNGYTQILQNGDNDPTLQGGVDLSRLRFNTGQKYKCPKCGDEPVNVKDGLPVAITTQMEGEKLDDNQVARLHCQKCFQNWQAEKTVREIRENVPELVKIEDYVAPEPEQSAS